MTAPRSVESVARYEGFDFPGQWAGRDAVTSLEERIVRRAFAGTTARRVLEAGVGFGRLTPCVAALAPEYVGADLDGSRFPSVARQVTRRRGSPPDLLVEANLLHLPFAPATFDLVVCVRVLHHVRDPLQLLAELARILAPGGTLVLSFAPKPTVATVRQDLGAFLANREPRIGLGADEAVELPGDPFPIVVPPRASVLGALRAAGIEPVTEFGEAPERLASLLPPIERRPARSDLPAGFFLPTRFVAGRRTGVRDPSLAPLRDQLVCPRCGAGVGPRSLAETWEVACPRCGFAVRGEPGVVRATYLPPGTEVHGVRTGGVPSAPPEGVDASGSVGTF